MARAKTSDCVGAAAQGFRRSWLLVQLARVQISFLCFVLRHMPLRAARGS